MVKSLIMIPPSGSIIIFTIFRVVNEIQTYLTPGLFISFFCLHCDKKIRVTVFIFSQLPFLLLFSFSLYRFASHLPLKLKGLKSFGVDCHEGHGMLILLPSDV